MAAPSHLLIVAHPDDETIFFGGLVLSLKKRNWKIIVATDANADGQGRERREQFAAACKNLGVKNHEMWDFPDIFEQRLNTTKLIERLSKEEKPRMVFTHGIIGEYGHPHHQDVSYAVHKAFQKRAPVWSVAYNSFATKSLRLTKKIYAQKAKILSEIYKSETMRFARLLPMHASEGFQRTSLSEVEAIYAYMTGQTPTVASLELKTYKQFSAYLAEQRKASQERPF
jgi:LmbE family N-acetylglucosaminyl deacetylase